MRAEELATEFGVAGECELVSSICVFVEGLLPLAFGNQLRRVAGVCLRGFSL